MVSTSLSFNKHWNRDEKQQAEFSFLLDCQVAQRIRQWVMPVPKPSQIIFSKKPLPFIKIVSGYNWYNKK